MRRRPIDDHATIDVAKVAGDVRADLLVGHVRNATVGSLRTENTHPFRYRQWLFAQTGTLPSFESIRERLVASVPEFLRSSIRGETDAEILFYVFLSFLHDAGRLNDALMAIRRTFAMRSARASPSSTGWRPRSAARRRQVNVMVSDGENVFALHRGAQMGYRVFSGKGDAEALIGDDLGLRRKTPELAQMHFTLLASDFDDEWSIAASTPRGSVALEGRAGTCDRHRRAWQGSAHRSALSRRCVGRGVVASRRASCSSRARVRRAAVGLARRRPRCRRRRAVRTASRSSRRRRCRRRDRPRRGARASSRSASRSPTRTSRTSCARTSARSSARTIEALVAAPRAGGRAARPAGQHAAASSSSSGARR